MLAKNINAISLKIFTILALLFTLNACPKPAKNSTDQNNNSKKRITLIIYIAADNNLRDFAARNIKQMAATGSNEHMNILVHLDIRLIGNKKTTRRYLINKNQVIHINSDQEIAMDSGDPNTLIDCCKWAVRDFPAEQYALIFWNHGTGIIDPLGRRLVNTEELYCYNPSTGRYELDRTIGFIEFMEALEDKGICWDDTTGNYLSNQKLEHALATIQRDVLQGKKFDLIGFDTCLMAMLEIAEITKKYAHIQVSSQEVEPGPGWDYASILTPFVNTNYEATELAQIIVRAYQEIYSKITSDFTLSAINLDYTQKLEANVNDVATLLLHSMPKNPEIKQAVLESKSKQNCTHFDEPSYKDLYHLYQNLRNLLLKQKQSKKEITELIGLLEKGMKLIDKSVIANVRGRVHLKQAHGISIYFPEKKIHPSYKKSSFAASNKWSVLITQLLIP